MKKYLLIALMAIASVAYVNAQPRAVGVNLGCGASFSYQHNLGAANMIDLAVEVPAFAGIGATCTYDWIDPFNTSIPWNNKGEWHWAMGVGGGAGFIWGITGGYAGVVGHIGVGYDFWFPLELSFDWRPNIGAYFWDGGAGFNGAGLYSGITLGVRYKF